ncbi:hypothetical protein [Paraburkholderia sp. Cy-641]|uniref:hypothetical protein n=1 Tax=Paraburkholderia sp. Cy-641 TaxID=2608337 RepID=UPI00196569C6|nr:hypothetical protein [Paraburkholderia sp. Cy-641]
MTFKPTEAKITLHGLGFLQLQLAANMRLHVWHPELPRRSCFEHSSIHDHRFGFESRVLVGTQINHIYWPSRAAGAETHTAYLHEGERTPFGNRPWLPDYQLTVVKSHTEVVPAGKQYSMDPYVFHSTEPADDGRVATLMTKTFEGRRGAHSLCAIGVDPDADFDRNQLSEHRMWEFVRDVLGDIAVIPNPRCMKREPCECDSYCGDDGKGRRFGL